MVVADYATYNTRRYATLHVIEATPNTTVTMSRDRAIRQATDCLQSSFIASIDYASHVELRHEPLSFIFEGIVFGVCSQYAVELPAGELKCRYAIVEPVEAPLRRYL